MTNKYLRTIYGVDKEGNAGSLQVDVYDILDAYPTKNPALDHLIKKALCPGQRGHKDLLTDLEDIIKSAHRAKAMIVNRMACITEGTIDNIPDDIKELLTSQTHVLKAAPVKPPTARPTSFKGRKTIYAFPEKIRGLMPKLIEAVNGVCGLEYIEHIDDALAGSAVVGNYPPHEPMVDGRFTYGLAEALEILANDKKKDATNA